MVKNTKNTKKATNANTYHPLIVAGYVLFALLIVSVIFSTIIPFSTILFQPGGVQRFNVGLFLVALTIGALLPTLLGYIVGGHAVKTKSTISHHFNGILFGLLAFWLMITPLSFPVDFLADSPALRLIIQNLIPSVGVVVLTSLLAIVHAKGRHAKRDLIEYKPFSIALIAAIFLLPIASIGLYDSFSLSISTTLPFIVPVVLGAVSYVALRKSNLTTASKITWSAISVSVGYAASFVLAQLIPSVAYLFNATPTVEYQTITSWISLALALVSWVAYWTVQVKVLFRKNNRE